MNISDFLKCLVFYLFYYELCYSWLASLSLSPKPKDANHRVALVHHPLRGKTSDSDLRLYKVTLISQSDFRSYCAESNVFLLILWWRPFKIRKKSAEPPVCHYSRMSLLSTLSSNCRSIQVANFIKPIYYLGLGWPCMSSKTTPPPISWDSSFK